VNRHHRTGFKASHPLNSSLSSPKRSLGLGGSDGLGPSSVLSPAALPFLPLLLGWGGGGGSISFFPFTFPFPFPRPLLLLGGGGSTDPTEVCLDREGKETIDEVGDAWRYDGFLATGGGFFVKVDEFELLRV